MKNIVCATLLTLAAITSATAASTPLKPVTASDDIRAIIEMMRSDLNTSKIRTLNEVMELTGPEAERFWPIYRQYEKDLASVGDRKLALIQEFASLRSAGEINQATWDSLAQRWLKNVQERLELWRKYQKKIAKAVSPMRAAQFLQVENQIALFVDLNIAAEMPAGLVKKPIR